MLQWSRNRTSMPNSGDLDRYGYEDNLETTMLPFALQSIGMGFIFQQDNDAMHTSGHIRVWFKMRHVQVLDWPSQSPDLNPIEHFWNELARRMKSKTARNSAETLLNLKKLGK
ncbi:hypothetical protein TELCIR_22080, partial [Teladorsagia circumcincta]